MKDRPRVQPVTNPKLAKHLSLSLSLSLAEFRFRDSPSIQNLTIAEGGMCTGTYELSSLPSQSLGSLRAADTARELPELQQPQDSRTAKAAACQKRALSIGKIESHHP